MKVLLVEWLDASAENFWASEDDLNIHPHLTLSAGFFIKESKDFLVLASTYDPYTESNNARMIIPKSMIKKRTVLWTPKKTQS